MATPKKKPSSAKTSKQKSSPFKVKKSTVPTKADDIVTPPEEIAEAIDAFRQASDQAKYFEGEATIYKNTIVDFARGRFAKRFFEGSKSGFKIQGGDSVIMYIVQDSSAGFSDEERDEFAERWGEKAAEELIVRDFASIRFNEKTLEAHYDEVVRALETLPEEVLENLFKPMLMRAKPGALDSARRFTKNTEEFQAMIRDLKIKNYIK